VCVDRHPNQFTKLHSRLRCVTRGHLMAITSPSSSSEASRAISPDYVYRPCCPEDYEPLRQAHLLLPVDYQDSFFLAIAQSKAPFFSFCCISDNGLGHLIGFVTAKVVPLASVPHNDQQCLQWALQQSAGDSPGQAAYITTIGVYPEYRRKGIATNLLKLVCQVSCFLMRHGVCWDFLLSCWPCRIGPTFSPALSSMHVRQLLQDMPSSYICVSLCHVLAMHVVPSPCTCFTNHVCSIGVRVHLLAATMC
jgi:hypothetical protein